ncbi:helix-turn-helix transcriptional regulator [Pseudorhodobacter sp. E13]|uniref:LexA family transcriptional regulator n=1 Tax=Pseudorhodobacter sp. E13 TaxID=2487931 RepID=UPI000F99F2BC|nr:S24 family peptidase [Pseudorhodobacter sp. E13]RUS64910.1 helix-turn-helix transcriptional regulator [Pseudorhodobacter sp. E13]
MENSETLLQKIEARRLELGLSQTEVSQRAFGKSDNSAISNMKRGSSPNFDRASQLCAALGLELYVGPPRESGPVEQLLLEGTDFAPVHRLDVCLSAGPGAENGDHAVVETMAFRRDWLAKMNIAPSAAVLVRVAGDSMQPGLHDGDMALVDTAQKTIRSGQIYAVTDIDARTLVKRVDTLGGEGLLLRSDNPEFAPIIRLGDEANNVTIHGRVVWSGHVWG